MQFRDLKRQYQALKQQIDSAISSVLSEANYISGKQVKELEYILSDYIGVKHCITCGNGTDALEISLIAMGVKNGDAVFVPDFTFFASAEAPVRLGATPVFVDINSNTYNIDPASLETAIKNVIQSGKLIPKVIISVDLFGLPADYNKIKEIAQKYNIMLLEDGAQGFGGKYYRKKACSFGNISTTSFFPAKPLGCYGDGGAVFTDSDEYASLIRSICVHGKGSDKYHNIRIGTNSRMDTIQAAILIEKFKAFKAYELENMQNAAAIYSSELNQIVKTPIIPEECYSSWAQYTICTNSNEERDALKVELKRNGIPTNIYYVLPLHKQKALEDICVKYNVNNTTDICKRVLSLPFGPYISEKEIKYVCGKIKDFYC